MDQGQHSSEVQGVINWVSRLVLDLCANPDNVVIKARTDAKGLLITVLAPKNELGRLIGKQGQTAQAMRAIAHSYGSRFGARVHIKINGVEDEPLTAPGAESVAAPA